MGQKKFTQETQSLRKVYAGLRGLRFLTKSLRRKRRFTQETQVNAEGSLLMFGQGRKGRQRQRNSDQERQGEYLHYLRYLRYLITEFIVSFQVRMELGIADHVWQRTRAKIALTVDSLGDDFRPLFRHLEP